MKATIDGWRDLSTQWRPILLAGVLVLQACGQEESDIQSRARFISDSSDLPPGDSCIASNIWTEIPASPMSGRDQAAVFWTGTEYLVFGGVQWGDNGNLSFFQDGAKFNPTSQTWASMSKPTGLSKERWDMSYALGDGKFLAWGGHTKDSTGNQGALYDISKNQWTLTSTIRAPEGRAYHMSVYANSKFYIWGGTSSGGSSIRPLNNGGIYNPSNNTWSAMPLMGAPSAVSYFAHAASKEKLFVWGGTPDLSPFAAQVSSVSQSGSVYDFTTSTWKAMSTTNAPSARRNAIGVWTGSKFLVWGGTGAKITDYVNSGGLYDPTTNSWTAISTTNAPSGRIFPYYAWTGDRLIVWGGSNSSYLNDGAVFDPATNSWTPMNDIDQPPHRRTTVAASNLWNGKSFLVWSGYSDTQSSLNSGALFVPPSSTPCTK